MILVFAGPGYYPAGGIHDLVAAVPDIVTAEAALELARIEDDSLEWAHLYDVDGGAVVGHYERDDYKGGPWHEPRHECWLPSCGLTDSEED